jgi:fucose permease
MLIFLLYVGLDVAAGSWAYTLLTEGRGIGEGPAGIAVTGYWVALTAVRIGLGIAGERTRPAPAATAAVIAVAVFTGLLWWSPSPWVGPVALVLLGASFGPIFPLQTFLTPQRVGAEATTAMVGYQMAAASVGAIVIPGGLGPLVAEWGVGIVPPVLFVGALALVAVDAAARRVSR